MQYHIVIVALDPTVGHEIQKTRPCVVISPDDMNDHLSTVIICPLTTTQRDNYPTRIGFTAENGLPNWIVVDQMRSIDKIRIRKITDEKLPEEVIETLKDVIREMLVD